MDAPGIGALIKSTRPDAVLIPGWYSISLVRAALSCRQAGIPVIYRGDTQLAKGRPPLKRALSGARTRAMINMFDAFLAAGVRNAEYLSAVGVPTSKTFPAPHAVDNDFFAREAAKYADPARNLEARERTGIAMSDFALLFVGKLEVKKRPWQVIEAAASLGTGTAVVIAGTGEAEQHCRETASRLGVRTVFKGFVNQTQLGEVYGTADCLVLPSDERETWGLVVNEAMASGLPCVVSDAVGCSPDLIVEGKTGAAFPLDDVVQLSRAAGSIRDAAKGGVDFAHNCRQHIAQYSFKAATNGLERAASFVVRNK
jgi:glycosyltransferase involved in cell wall biosynthesis